eukprot:TRINITY_DN14450_c0_g1_i1.p1 TRINITY_DN14450_c0_g1~~TRINITY_DN14450_c0_g1_i1.p1  ORF type:complete len:1633 (+),score=444.49 TRINITY_DN14450_c0_g1_i1:58-4956(+)
MLAYVALAAGVLGGEQQCPPRWSTCLYNADTTFGSAYQALWEARYVDRIQGRLRESLCTRAHWETADRCQQECPFGFHVTAPSRLAGMQMCLEDNVFAPYNPEAHIDAEHVLNKKEVELVAVGAPEGKVRHGCNAEDFVAPVRNFTGRVALISRGSCYFYRKFQNAYNVGAVAGIMVNSVTGPITEQLMEMSGTSEGFPMPSAMLPRHYGRVLFDALDAGETVKGYFNFDCARVTDSPDPSDNVRMFDGCPDVRLREHCREEPVEENRLCAECPLALEAGAAKVCLWGSQLSPQVQRNYFQHALPPPHVFDDGDVVLADGLLGGGCVEADYSQLKGKVVVLPAPQGCLAVEALRAASAQGVAGVIVATTEKQVGVGVSPMLQPEGPSHVVRMPVHAIDTEGYGAVLAYAKAAQKHVAFATNATGWEIPAARLVAGRAAWTQTPADGTQAATADPGEASAAFLEEKAFDTTPVIAAVGFAVIPLLVIAVCAAYAHQRAHRVRMAAPEGGIPLGLASMGLSLTLLAVIAGVAFVLAHFAGKEATHTAVADGRAAAGATYDNAVDNVGELAARVRSGIILQVRKGVLSTLTTGEAAATAAATAFMDFDGTWDSFAQHVPAFLDLGRQVYKHGWAVQVFTTNGFFANIRTLTDDRPNGERPDDVPAPVRVTNEGWRYGFYVMNYDSNKFEHEYWAEHPLEEFNVSRQLGGRPGDPLAVTENRARDSMQWHVTKLSFPHQYTEDLDTTPMFIQPLSVFTPLRNRQKQWLGTIEARTQLSNFGDVVAAATAGPALENMTVAIFDGDLNVIGTNAFVNTKYRGSVYKTVWRAMRTMFTMADAPPVHFKAFANYMDRLNGWSGHSGMFEQRAEYTPQDLVVFRIGVRNGQAADVSGDANDVEMRGRSCGRCVTDSGLRFTGENVMYIYRNLSTAAPRVAATQVMTPDGSWESTLPEYSDVSAIPNASTSCVSYTDHGGYDAAPTTQCLLREQWTMLSYTVSMAVKPDSDIADGVPGVNPVLFTDASVGTSFLRLYGNGVLQLGTLFYGCETKALAGGMPGGVWTTITAVVDYEANACIVYVNGTLASAGEMALELFDQKDTSEDLGRPYVVGQRYKGAIADLTVYNISLSAAEAASIHATGALVREVPVKHWYSDLQPLLDEGDAKAGSHRSGLASWGVVAMLPRDDIMRQVDANNRVTARNLKVQEANTYTKLKEKNVESILIVVAIGLGSVVVFMVFNEMLTKPFAQCALVMLDAAVMKVDVLDDVGSSFVQELNTMRHAMALMVNNLREYKSYMPQNVLLESDDDDDCLAVSLRDNLGGSEVRSGSAIISGVRVQMGESSVMSVGSSRRSHNTGSAHPALTGVHKHAVMGLALHRKKVTFLVSNIRGFLGAMLKMNDAEVLRRHCDVLSLTLAAFATHKGVSEMFSGDRFVSSFNAVRTCSSHRNAGCAAALHLRDESSTVLRPVSAEAAPQMKMNFAIVSGDGRIGNCGNEHMKRFSFLTPVLSWGHGLERLGAHTKVDIVVDHYVFEEAANMYYVRYLNSVAYSKRSEHAVRVAELLCASTSGERDEWMYEMHSAQMRHPCGKWNAFAQAVLDGNWMEAEALRAEAITDESGPLMACFNEQLEAKQLLPMQLLFH